MTRYNAVSIFSGAGGLDLGMERAGFRTVAMCEREPVFAETLRANRGARRSAGAVHFADARILQADVREVAGRELAEGADVDCLVGGPPCQAFSSSGKQLSVLDPRGALVDEFVRLVREVRPKTFVFENVRGLVTARDEQGVPGGVARRLYHSLEQLGYSCRAGLLNAADYGSFQRRVRCFILGSRVGAIPEFPAPTHQRQGSDGTLAFSPPWRTLGDFLAEFADRDSANYVFPTPALAAELALLPDGTGLKSKGAAEPTRPGGHWGYRQGTFIADQALPARTVTGSASQDWVRWQGILRRLTLLEAKRLQGFPDDWTLAGNAAAVFKQIGNAVPTVFGEALGRILAEHLAKPGLEAPRPVPFPAAFDGYIAHTTRDHVRNASARRLHRKFSERPQRVIAQPRRLCGGRSAGHGENPSTQTLFIKGFARNMRGIFPAAVDGPGGRPYLAGVESGIAIDSP